jgi:intracellular septation protein A
MKIWIYRHRFAFEGTAVEIVTEAGMADTATHLRIDGRTVATDRAPFRTEGLRIMEVEGRLPDGRLLKARVGYNSWWTVGMEAFVEGTRVWESHPGKPIALPRGAEKMFGPGAIGMRPADVPDQRWAIGTDIALAILFYIVAKMTDLRTAALFAAGAGLALVVVQRFVRVDLLGGLALFGILMTLIGAGFAILFEEDRMIQLRSTVLGAITASLFLTDGLLGGRYLGKRMARYLPMPGIDPGRLALGMGASGVVMALANWIVVDLATKDQWLFYTTFLDLPLAMGLFFAALRYARAPARSPA